MVSGSDLRSRTLRRRFRGYETTAVNRLLADLAAMLDADAERCSDLRDRKSDLEAELAERESLDREMREMMISAQREIERMEVETSREAAAVRERARLDALEVSAALEEDHAEVASRLAEVRAVEADLRSRSREIVERALQELGTSSTALGAPAQVAPATHSDEEPAPGTIEDTQAIPVVAPETVASDAPPEPHETASVFASPASDVSATSETNGRTRRRSFAFSLAILLVGALVVVGIWQLSAADGASKASASPVPSSSLGASTIVDAAEAQSPAVDAPEASATAVLPDGTPSGAGAVPEPAKLAVEATEGDCWLQVRRGSAKGKILYDGFLYLGDRETFTAMRLWIRVGNGANLTATLNGSGVETLPAGTGNAVVTAQGVRVVSLG